MTDKQPEALRLADALEKDKWHITGVDAGNAADELRTQHATITALQARIAELERDVVRLKGLRELCGYVFDGSQAVVRLHQDDAARTFHIDVDSVRYYGESFDAAIDAAMQQGEQK